jgi:predicted AlkP superfamily phosphohydrolase/phosphomutase
MKPRSPVLIVGLDACDPAIARHLAASGRMPTLARLFDRAARCQVRNPHGLFVGALWVSFATGIRADRHRFHCWDHIDVASYVRRLTAPPDNEQPRFWHTLSDAGRRVAVLDVPHAKADVPLNGLQVAEWGCHDRHFGFHTWPSRRAAEIDAAFGLHPILGMDAYSDREFAPDDYIHRSAPLRTLEEEVALFDGLQRGLNAKRKLNAELLADGDWDVFLTVFGESHAVGHQLWHQHDPNHPRFQSDQQRAFGGDPVAQLYGGLDAALGEMLSLVSTDATVLVLLSHGMGPHYDGTHLLDEVLGHLDLFNRAPPTGRGPKHVLKGAARALPGALQRHVTAFATPAIRRRIAGHPLVPCPEFAEPHNRARQRYFMEPNNSVIGGIRLNLAGREPQGCVQPDDVDAVCRQLRNDLLALVNVDTGGPVIRDVERVDRWYRRSSTDTMPDLFIDWERTAPIETVWSPKVGLVHAPYANWRSGDHRPDGLLLAFGPGIPAGTLLPSLDTEDFAPSIAARLGVAMADVDGRPAGWLSGRQ